MWAVLRRFRRKNHWFSPCCCIDPNSRLCAEVRASRSCVVPGTAWLAPHLMSEPKIVIGGQPHKHPQPGQPYKVKGPWPGGRRRVHALANGSPRGLQTEQDGCRLHTCTVPSKRMLFPPSINGSRDIDHMPHRPHATSTTCHIDHTAHTTSTTRHIGHIDHTIDDTIDDTIDPINLIIDLVPSERVCAPSVLTRRGARGQGEVVGLLVLGLRDLARLGHLLLVRCLLLLERLAR